MSTTQIGQYEQEEIFARVREDGNYDILFSEDGSAVTTLNTYPTPCWAVGSRAGLSGSYEHPEGIVLDAAQVARLGIEIE